MCIVIFNNTIGILSFGSNTDMSDRCFNMLIDYVDREIDDTR